MSGDLNLNNYYNVDMNITHTKPPMDPLEATRLFVAERKEQDRRIEKDPFGKSPNDSGAKVDAGKTKVWLMLAGFSRALEEVAKVTTVGADKYTENGWVDVPDGKKRYMEAFARHMLAVGKGEVWDNGLGGTNCMHKGQMIWNLLASLELELRENEKVSTISKL